MGTADETGGGAGARTVTLREARDGADTRSLHARLDAQGNLCIEGHDLGPTVSGLLGGSEYEWAISVAAGLSSVAWFEAYRWLRRREPEGAIARPLR